jgi:hypothetical protein
MKKTRIRIELRCDECGGDQFNVPEPDNPGETISCANCEAHPIGQLQDLEEFFKQPIRASQFLPCFKFVPDLDAKPKPPKQNPTIAG